MIKITDEAGLHAVLTKLDSLGAVWDFSGHKASWLEDSLRDELQQWEIIIEISHYFNGKEVQSILRWYRPLSAEEYLKGNEDY